MKIFYIMFILIELSYAGIISAMHDSTRSIAEDGKRILQPMKNNIVAPMPKVIIYPIGKKAVKNVVSKVNIVEKQNRVDAEKEIENVFSSMNDASKQGKEEDVHIDKTNLKIKDDAQKNQPLELEALFGDK